MQIKTIASAALLATALGLSSVAYAQTKIGNQTVSEADMERVKVFCEDLKTADGQAVGADDSTAESSAEEDSPTTVGDVDIDAITLENCIEAGFVQR